MKTTLIFASLLLVVGIGFTSCKKAESTQEDEAILEAINEGPLYFYQGNDVVLNAAGNSPHGNFKLLFNQTAWDALDSTGRLPQGATFPEGSLIVKDVCRNNGTDLYAVMWKKAGSGNASNGWVWNEIRPDGEVVISVTEKGKACVSCHRGNTNHDLVTSFDLH